MFSIIICYVVFYFIVKFLTNQIEMFPYIATFYSRKYCGNVQVYKQNLLRL